ncbi:MAG TPA: 4-hydroxythreonine-4-phosphate dehydrogenase PdxA [Polyangiaceae bacterium]|nr:4-hydroxythreonine-4-phosphate dehydrogenase PdxA [Polyangiaceae bacterium]
MSKKKAKSSRSKTSKPTAAPVVLTMGCPSGVGPEIAVAACTEADAPPAIIVGDRGVLEAAARALGRPSSLVAAWPDYEAGAALRGIQIASSSALAASERPFGRPTAAGGRAQLAYIEDGFALAKRLGLPLVTGPVSKEAIARSGLARARKFRGHTEWLEELDGAPHSVMCFASERLVTSLVTTHLPLARVPRALDPAGVTRSIIELWDLLARLGRERPRVAVASLNPHAGEGELLGREEIGAIIPGIERAASLLGRRVRLTGPIGAETAYRKAAGGHFDGVVAMYHDQATIPMKLLDFGGAVNVTQGLGIVRTSVDHGTAYDIAGRGLADPRGLRSAVQLAARLGAARRRAPAPPW